MFEEESPLDTSHPIGTGLEESDDEEFGINVTSTEPSPFSQKKEKVLFCSDKVLR